MNDVLLYLAGVGALTAVIVGAWATGEQLLAHVAKRRARRRCHGTPWCCQYQDQPMCNSSRDPHRVARWRYRRQLRRVDG